MDQPAENQHLADLAADAERIKQETAALQAERAQLQADQQALADERAALAANQEAFAEAVDKLQAQREQLLADQQATGEFVAPTMRAKFKVETLDLKDEGNAVVVLRPVTEGSAENKEFFRYTPWGEIRIGTINRAVAEQLRPTREFYVDFTAVPA